MAGTRVERINIITEFDAKGTDKYRQQVEGTKKSISGIGGIVSSATRVLAGLFAVQQVTAFTRSMVSMAAQYETTSQSIEVFVGSAEKAQQVIQDLSDFAVRTPFAQDEVIQAGKTLLAFGTQAEDLIGIVNSLGEAAAASNTSIANLAFVFGQVRAQGKAQLQDLYQFVNAGVPIFELLADSMGRNVTEIKKLTSAGKITSVVLEQAFKKASQEGGRFQGALEKQAQTLTGITSTLRDEISNTVRNIGIALLPQIKELANQALAFVRTLDPEKIKDFALGIVSFVKEAIPLIVTLGRATAGYLVYKGALETVTIAQRLFNTAVRVNPFAILITGLAVILPEITKLARILTGTTKEMTALRDISKQVSVEFNKEAGEATKLFNTLRDVNSTTKERKEALEQLNEQYPEVLANYDLEKGAIEDIDAAQKALNASIIQGIEVRLIESAADRFNEARERIFSDLQESPSWIQFMLYGPNAANARGSQSIKELELLENAFNATKNNIKKQAQEIGESIFGTGQSEFGNPLTSEALTQDELNQSIQTGLQLRKELSKLSDDELRKQLATKDIEVLRRKTIQEILAERKRLQSAGTGEEIAAALGSLEALEKKLKDVEERISKASPEGNLLDGLTRQANTLNTEIDLLKLRIQTLRDVSIERLPTQIKDAEDAIQQFYDDQAKRQDERNDELDKLRDRANDLQQKRLNRLTRENEISTATQVRIARDKLLKDLQGLEANDFREREEAYRVFQNTITKIQIEEAKERAKIAKQSGDARGEQDALDQELQLRIQLIEDGGIKLQTKLQESLGKVSEFIQNSISPIIDGAIQASQALEDLTQRSIDAQTRRVEAAKELAERGNADLLKLEEDRLRESEDRQRRAAETTRELAAIQILANSAIAVTKTAAESGILAPVTIVTTLAAILSGLAAVRGLSQGFVEGTEYVSGKPGVDKIPARLTKGERVVDAKTNAKLDAFPNKDLPKAVGLYRIFERLPVAKDTYHETQVQDFRELQSEMKKVNENLSRFRMNVSIDEFGLHAGVTSVDKVIKKRDQLLYEA